MHLSFSKKVLIFNCFLFLSLTVIFYKFLKFNKLTKATTSLSRVILSKKISDLKASEINDFHLKVGKIFFNFSCLPLCISAKLLLSIYGYETKIQSGIKLKEKNIKGHAWLVMKDNKLLNKNENIKDFQKSFLID